MKKACLVLSALMLLTGTAAANELAFGPRVGWTHDNNFDQFHFGGHMIVQHLTTNLHVIPSLEIGVGDGTLLAINGDLVYEFTELATGRWGFYGGGGPVFTFYWYESFNSNNIAFNLLAGTTFDLSATKELLAEIRFGLEDAPNLKLTLGLTFF